MRLLIYIGFYLISLSLLSACNSPQGLKVQMLSSQAAYAYKLKASCELPAPIELAVSAVAAPKQQLQLKMVWQNKGSDTLLLNLSEAMLMNSRGRRSGPLESGQGPVQLLPFSTDTLLLTYEPVSDLQLYQRTGLRGPLDSQYQLPLHYVQKGESPFLKDTLRFYLPPPVYKAFLFTSKAAKPVRLYKMNKSVGMENRLRSHISRLKTAKESVENIRIMEEEVFVAGVNTRVGIYEQGDSLYLNLAIINHSPDKLKINPDHLMVGGKGKAAPLQKGKSLILLKGERYFFKNAYDKPQADSLWLYLKGIGVVEGEESLLPYPFLLTAERAKR